MTIADTPASSSPPPTVSSTTTLPVPSRAAVDRALALVIQATGSALPGQRSMFVESPTAVLAAHVLHGRAAAGQRHLAAMAGRPDPRVVGLVMCWAEGSACSNESARVLAREVRALGAILDRETIDAARLLLHASEVALPWAAFDAATAAGQAARLAVQVAMGAGFVAALDELAEHVTGGAS